MYFALLVLLGFLVLKDHLQAISDACICNAEKKYLRKRLIDNVSVTSHPPLPLAVQLESAITAAAKVVGKMSDGQPLRAPRLQRMLVQHGCPELALRVAKLNRARRQECHPDVTLAGAITDALIRPCSTVVTVCCPSIEDIDLSMEHEIEDWMRDTGLSAHALPFVPCSPVCEPISQSCHVIGHSDLVNQIQELSDKLTLCVQKLDSLSLKSDDDVMSMDKLSAPTVVSVSGDAELNFSVGPECDTTSITPPATDNHSHVLVDVEVACPTVAELLVSVVPECLTAAEARSSTSTDAMVAEDSPRTLKRKDFMRSQRLKQGITDERFAEMQLEKQAAAAAPPPAPQPQRTEEEVMRYMSDHLRRHYGPVPTKKVFVMPDLFD